jgi:hypothetical protein
VPVLTTSPLQAVSAWMACPERYAFGGEAVGELHLLAGTQREASLVGADVAAQLLELGLTVHASEHQDSHGGVVLVLRPEVAGGTAALAAVLDEQRRARVAERGQP